MMSESINAYSIVDGKKVSAEVVDIAAGVLRIGIGDVSFDANTKELEVLMMLTQHIGDRIIASMELDLALSGKERAQ